jgi:hypothetical protein
MTARTLELRGIDLRLDPLRASLLLPSRTCHGCPIIVRRIHGVA